MVTRLEFCAIPASLAGKKHVKGLTHLLPVSGTCPRAGKNICATTAVQLPEREALLVFES
jgi:hypothetical protein